MTILGAVATKILILVYGELTKTLPNLKTYGLQTRGKLLSSTIFSRPQIEKNAFADTKSFTFEKEKYFVVDKFIFHHL